MTTNQPPRQVDVCIVGCGPAGAMLGLLLARAGVEVVVLEKYPDFHRDFRGDTIHASTLQVLDELDLMPAFDRLPHQPTRTIAMMTDDGLATLGDFTRLPGSFQYLSMVPQWDFLALLTSEAATYPTFTLIRSAEVTDLILDRDVVRGVRYEAGGRSEELRAALTVACDGRHSVVREAAGLAVKEYGVPLDVLWLRIPKGPGDPSGSFARLGPGRLFPVIDRGSYWQVAVTMTKGGFGSLRSAGLAAFRADLSRWLPFAADRIDRAVQSWDDTGFLEVRVNRLRRWHRTGLLCIGDAAHAMSPVAGVGINLAIQDAVAAANLLDRGPAGSRHGDRCRAGRGAATSGPARPAHPADPAAGPTAADLRLRRSGPPGAPASPAAGAQSGRSAAPPVLPLLGPRPTQRARRSIVQVAASNRTAPRGGGTGDRAARRGAATGRLVRRVRRGVTARCPHRSSGLGRRDLRQRAALGAASCSPSGRPPSG